MTVINMPATKHPKTYKLRYPRKRLARFFVRLLGRLIMPLFFKLEISGMDNFPGRGPVLVVGNHTAAMEAVILNVYSRRPIEMLSAADTPGEWITELVANLFGVIPLHRGSYDRAALQSALDVLAQDGFIGLFPEGGIWQEGKKKALPGIAWLSVKSGAPVLPIAFNDTAGALNSALRFQRPTLTMQVGRLIEAAELPPDQPRKLYLQEYADQVMEAVHALVPQDQYISEPEIIQERFELAIQILDPGDEQVQVPAHLSILHPATLAKFLHRPAILKIFRFNLDLPVDVLQNLGEMPPVADLLLACREVLKYLAEENPYLLTYRFGVKEGLAMQESLRTLKQLLQWCLEEGYKIRIQPVRTYYSLKENREIRQIEQGSFHTWM